MPLLQTTFLCLNLCLLPTIAAASEIGWTIRRLDLKMTMVSLRPATVWDTPSISRLGLIKLIRFYAGRILWMGQVMHVANMFYA